MAGTGSHTLKVLWRPLVDHEKVLFVIVFFCCSSNEKEKTGLQKRSRGKSSRSELEWSGTLEKKVGRQLVKFKMTLCYRGCHPQHLAHWKSVNHWIRETLCHSKSSRSVWEVLQCSPGSCANLASDRGPSCTKLEQIKGSKVYFVRFRPSIGNVYRIFTSQEVKWQPSDGATKSAPFSPYVSALGFPIF